MSTVLKNEYYSPDEYLKLEAEAEYKSEYFQGEIFMMAGASPDHNRIQSNAVYALRAALKGKPCETFTSDMRVLVQENGLYTYPDAVVACGEPEFSVDYGAATLLNPVLIVEVCSDSTREYDRDTKFELYRGIETFSDYLLIDQDRLHVEYWHKIEPNEWRYQVFSERSGVITVDTLAIAISIDDLYQNVKFESPRPLKIR